VGPVAVWWKKCEYGRLGISCHHEVNACTLEVSRAHDAARDSTYCLVFVKLLSV
jgi:hypothetical protein